MKWSVKTSNFVIGFFVLLLLLLIGVMILGETITWEMSMYGLLILLGTALATGLLPLTQSKPSSGDTHV